MKTTKKVEEPKFNLIKKQDKFEIREYEQGFVFAEVIKKNNRKSALYESFVILSEYIFTKHEFVKTCQNDLIKEYKSISMTAPVIQYMYNQENNQENQEINDLSIENNDQTWGVRFIMPSEFNINPKALPTPKTTEINIIDQTGSQKFLCLLFNGNANNQVILEKIYELKNFIKINSIKTKNNNIYISFYNPPWTIPSLKRNELWIEIE